MQKCEVLALAMHIGEKMLLYDTGDQRTFNIDSLRQLVFDSSSDSWTIHPTKSLGGVSFVHMMNCFLLMVQNDFVV